MRRITLASWVSNLVTDNLDLLDIAYTRIDTNGVTSITFQDIPETDLVCYELLDAGFDYTQIFF